MFPCTSHPLLKAAPAVILFALLPAPGRADAPDNPADAFLFYSRQPDPGGDTSGALVQSSLFTGVATHSIPIVVPKGTGGVEPSLRLTYNSSRGSGTNAGTGWSLEFPKVRRLTKYAGVAVFEYSGDELVQGADESDPFGCKATRYYSLTEHFEKILHQDPHRPRNRARGGGCNLCDEVLEARGRDLRMCLVHGSHSDGHQS
jgi:hypothetical protein